MFIPRGVATWTIYSKTLQRRGHSTTEIIGIAPVGALPQPSLPLPVIIVIVTLYDLVLAARGKGT